VFDLPVIVGIEEGLFEKAGLDVSFSATYADRERDSAEKPVLSRLKEQMFEAARPTATMCASGEHRPPGTRQARRHIAALRAAVAAQAILTFDEKLQTPRDLATFPWWCRSSRVRTTRHCKCWRAPWGASTSRSRNGSLPSKRWEGLRDRRYRAVAVMEPFISLGLKEGAHIIAASFYRGGEVVAAI